MKSLTDLVRDWADARRKMEKSISDIPRIAGIVAVKVIRQNFEIQGYDSGIGITKWPKRSPKTDAAYDRGKTVNAKTGKLSKYRTGKNGTYKGSVFSSSKPILDQTGALKNSVNYVATKRSVFVGINLSLVPYAIAHNQGLHHEPQRKFMPLPNEKPNIKMLRAIESKIIYERKQAMKTFAK